MADPLVTWAVEIDASEGVASLRDQLGEVQADLTEAEEAAKEAGQAISQAMGQAAQAGGGAVGPQIPQVGPDILPARMQPQPQLRVDQDAEPLGPVTLADATPQVESIQGPQLPSPELLQTWEKIHQAMQRAAGGAEGFQAAVEMERSKILPYDDLAKQLEEVEKHYRGGFLAADNAQRIVDNLAKQATARTREHTDALEKQAREMERQHAQAGKLALVYGVASAALLGWVRAGLQGTAEGERMGLMFGLVSREIASIFTPAIHAMIRALENAYAALRELTGGQQETIRNTAAMVLGFLGIATLVPRLIGSVQALGAALSGALAAQPVLFLVSALGGLLLATEDGRAALGELASAMEPIMRAAVQVAQAFGTVAEAIAPTIRVLSTVLGWIAKLLGPVLEFVAPVVALTLLFNALGNAIVAAFVRGAAAIGGATAALTANTAAATANAAANTAAGAASGAASAGSAAAGAAGGFLGRVGGFLSGPLGLIPSLGLGLLGGLFSLFGSRKEEKPAERLSPSSGTFESIESSYQRVQQEVARTDIAQRTRERSLGVLEEIRDGVRRPRDSTASPVAA